MSYRGLQGRAGSCSPWCAARRSSPPATWESVLAPSRRASAKAGSASWSRAGAATRGLPAPAAWRRRERPARRISWSPPGAFHRRLPGQGRQEPEHAGPPPPGPRTDGAVDELLARRTCVRWSSTARTRHLAGRGRRARARAVPGRTRHGSRETAEYANVVLPIGTYAESDGTFTNHAGAAAFPAGGEAARAARGRVEALGRAARRRRRADSLRGAEAVSRRWPRNARRSMARLRRARDARTTAVG